MCLKKIIFVLGLSVLANAVFAAEGFVGGKITKLLAHPTDPAIVVGASAVPTGCDGGAWGWMRRKGDRRKGDRFI